MPHTIIAYSESISQNVLQPVAAVADPHVRVEGDKIYVPSFDTMILGVIAVGTNLQRARLVSPELRKVANIEVTPVQRGAVAPGSPPAVQLFTENPVPLVENDILTTEAIHDAAAAQQQTIIVILADAAPTPVTGANVRSVRCTTTVTLSAHEWVNAALTFDEDLPRGRYQVIGMRAYSANMIAARLVPVGEAHRPGCLGVTGLANLENPLFRCGKLGVWTEFDSLTPPSVDFLAAAADTNPEVILDVVPL